MEPSSNSLSNTIKGKTALVTGASRGLGSAFAPALLDAGATKVYAGARETVMSEDSVENLKREMDVNVLGMLAMCKAFAPVLARNGGGVIVNMLSVVS
jgi:NAD(P)-dependent dehydrogenase (short-subunit alcohol dehydrogenase family)